MGKKHIALDHIHSKTFSSVAKDYMPTINTVLTFPLCLQLCSSIKFRGMNMVIVIFYVFSLTLLLIICKFRGTGPSPRSNHVAALYGDKVLLVFGGQGKSRILNDLYSLDFETVCDLPHILLMLLSFFYVK